MSTVTETIRRTIPYIHALADQGTKIVMVTAYDYPSGRIADEAGVDMILVGDSLAMTMLGLPSTLLVTLDEMIVLTRAVSRATHRALLVMDMPFGSYTVSLEQAVSNAIRCIQEGGAEAVKVEGGETLAPTVRRLVQAGIPVMGHIGLTPQHVGILGGYRVQGRSPAAVRQLVHDARALEEAGAFAIVIESVPTSIGDALTRAVRIPTIGIGAGAECSGQVLVWHDMFGLYHGTTARFVRQYGDVKQTFVDGLAAYSDDVRTKLFPAREHTYEVPEFEREAIEEVLASEGLA